jgi:hypothetical protein
MTSIDNVAQIVAAIRQQLVARTDNRVRGAAGTRSSTESHAKRPDLFTLVGQRVKAIGRDDPDRGRKAFRIFLESVLIAELDESPHQRPAVLPRGRRRAAADGVRSEGRPPRSKRRSRTCSPRKRGQITCSLDGSHPAKK